MVTRYGLLPPVALLLAAFLILTLHLDRESLWYDEGWSVWAVRDVAPVTDVAPRDALRGLVTNIRTMVERVREDVHPPLYFLLLDGLTTVAGESVYVVRLLSSWAGLLGLAATYALGLRLTDRRTALLAVILLSTASFFIYYGREARMYTLLLALVTFTTLVYWHWLKHPTWGWTLVYGLLLAAILYTHYAGFVLVVVHGIHMALRFMRAVKLRYAVPYMMAAVLFLPWTPVLLDQLRTNPDGPLAAPVTTNLISVIDLLRILGGGALVIYLPLLVAGVIRLRNKRVLLLLWLILPPAVLFALNTTVIEIYQVRYVIYILPAWMLLAASGLRIIWWRGALIVITGAIVYFQLSAYTPIWGNKPDWRGATQDMLNSRALTEPAITYITPESITGYYDRQYGIKSGVTLDLAWRDHNLDEMSGYISALANAGAIWLVMPTNIPETWYAADLLGDTYTPTYRSHVLNMIFYRFDRDDPSSLQFHFGDLLRYDGFIGQQHIVKPGDTLCPEGVRLTTLAAVDNRYSVSLQLTPKHAPPITQWDSGLGTHEAGTTVTVDECMSIPSDTPPGHYHLRLIVYDWRTVENLKVFEQGINWGEALILGEVVVEPS